METYHVGDVANVRIVKLMTFGAFAEVVPGVDGLIHISQIADRRIEKPGDVLSEGQMVDAKITAIDEEKQKISCPSAPCWATMRTRPPRMRTRNNPGFERIRHPSGCRIFCAFCGVTTSARHIKYGMRRNGSMEYVIFIARSVTQAQRMMRTLAYADMGKNIPGPGGADGVRMQLCGENS